MFEYHSSNVIIIGKKNHNLWGHAAKSGNIRASYLLTSTLISHKDRETALRTIHINI